MVLCLSRAEMTVEPTPTVSVIMPTLARSARAPLLRRALESVVGQTGVRAVPIVVMNGAERDPGLVAELSRRRDLRRLELREGDLPAALRAGRAAVDTPWFAALDDDDVLLPGALARQLAHARAHPGCDVVVSNGIVRSESGDRPSVENAAGVLRDPLGALAEGTWLSPGGALFRTDAIGPGLFEGMPSFLEWTYLALRTARECHVSFLDEPGFVHHVGRPDSLWGSRECARRLPDALQTVLALDLPPRLRRCFEERLAGAFHGAANEALGRGERRSAWRAHARSLAGRRGWRYLAFTARLLAATPAVPPEIP